jgi:hypothetical protein
MQKKKGRKNNMLVPTIIMAVLAVVLLVVGYFKGEDQHAQGLQISWKMLIFMGCG